MQKTSTWSSLWPPIYLMGVQSTLEKEGHETRLLDCVASEVMVEELVERIRGFKPDFVVVNTCLPTIKEDLELAERLNDYKTIAVGASTKLVKEKFEKSCFHAIVSGDSEDGVLKVLKGAEGFVQGCIKDLDSMPFPSYRDIKIHDYTLPYTGDFLAPINVGRGCRNACVFCMVPVLNKGSRYRGAESVVAEMEMLTKKGVNHFLFWTENFTENRVLVEKVCKLIIKKGLKVCWMAPTRADTVDPKLLSLMKRAGCWMISFGVECLDQKVLDACNKRLSVKTIKKAVLETKKAGIKVVAHAIIGLPEQTRENVLDTVDWLIKNDVDYAQFYFATPFPHTMLRKIAKKKGWIVKESKGLEECSMRNEHMTCEELVELRNLAYRKFYFRPARVWKEIVGLKPKNFIPFVKSSLNFLNNWVKI